jgi:hypothetical protein
MSERLGQESPDDVRRLLRDPEVPAEVRRKMSETGSRRVRWYWELEASEIGAGRSRSA